MSSDGTVVPPEPNPEKKRGKELAKVVPFRPRPKDETPKPESK